MAASVKSSSIGTGLSAAEFSLSDAHYRDFAQLYLPSLKFDMIRLYLFRIVEVDTDS